MAERRTHFPTGALFWLASSRSLQVLTLSAPPALPRLLASSGHQVFATDRDPAVIRSLTASGTIVGVAAQPESLPFEPCRFDRVMAHQNFHTFAPGLALSEIARVLRPGGAATVTYLVRDDSVPWVRRLAHLVRQVDPDAMGGDYGTESVEALLESKYFPQHDTKTFRVWQPVTSQSLVAMVGAIPGVATQDAEIQRALLDDVAALYADASTRPDGMSLPYELRCWRAWVDHQELTAPITNDTTGLVIPI
ncbi:MAG TPA: methyltransferase domain-containing protein [Propionibacteriaceae bacterium]|nr:methyltransferase domain-containing protein [Propionibacteriaceae bacterium]